MSFEAKFLHEQKAHLEARRAELMRELDEDSTPNKHSPGDFDAKFPNFGEKDEDNAAEVEIFERNLSMEKNLEVSLFNVDKALRKIEDGTFGVCEKCGKSVGLERLKAFPSATACMDCKNRGL